MVGAADLPGALAKIHWFAHNADGLVPVVQFLMVHVDFAERDRIIEQIYKITKADNGFCWKEVSNVLNVINSTSAVPNKVEYLNVMLRGATNGKMRDVLDATLRLRSMCRGHSAELRDVLNSVERLASDSALLDAVRTLVKNKKTLLQVTDIIAEKFPVDSNKRTRVEH